MSFASGVTSIESHALSDVRFVTSITFPSTLKTIKDRAFHYNPNYKGAIVLPDSLTSLGIEAFMNTKITSVSFGSGLNEIGEAAFMALVGRMNDPSLTVREIYLDAPLVVRRSTERAGGVRRKKRKGEHP